MFKTLRLGQNRVIFFKFLNSKRFKIIQTQVLFNLIYHIWRRLLLNCKIVSLHKFIQIPPVFHFHNHATMWQASTGGN